VAGFGGAFDQAEAYDAGHRRGAMSAHGLSLASLARVALAKLDISTTALHCSINQLNKGT
jgi:hypothetical protein